MRLLIEWVIFDRCFCFILNETIDVKIKMQCQIDWYRTNCNFTFDCLFWIQFNLNTNNQWEVQSASTHRHLFDINDRTFGGFLRRVLFKSTTIYGFFSFALQSRQRQPSKCLWFFIHWKTHFRNDKLNGAKLNPITRQIFNEFQFTPFWFRFIFFSDSATN